MKIIVTILLFLTYSFVFSEDDKIQKIFDDTHKKVQEILKSDKIHPDRKGFDVKKEVDRGKKKLEDLKSFYVVRHAFDDAEKVKEAILKFESTDFKKQSLSPVVVVENKPKENKEKDIQKFDRIEKGSFLRSLHNYDNFPKAQKEDIAKKLIQPSKDGLLRIESDYAVIESNFNSYEIVSIIVRFEKMAFTYNTFCNEPNIEIKNKVKILAIKSNDATDTILNSKGIKIEDRSKYYEDYNRKSKTYVLIEQKKITYMSHNVLDSLAYAYGESIKSGGTYTYMNSLSTSYDFSNLEIVKKYMLFSNCMTTRGEKNALSDGDYDQFQRDLEAGDFGEYRNFKSQFFVFLVQRGDYKNVHSLVFEQGNEFFKKPNVKPLLIDFIKFYKTEVQLGSECNRMSRILIHSAFKTYRNMQENEDKIIILDAKYIDLPMTKYFKGLHYFLCEKYQESVDSLLSLGTNINKYPMVYSTLALAYFKLNKMDDAKKYKLKALAESDSDPLITKYGSQIPD